MSQSTSTTNDTKENNPSTGGVRPPPVQPAETVAPSADEPVSRFIKLSDGGRTLASDVSTACLIAKKKVAVKNRHGEILLFKDFQSEEAAQQELDAVNMQIDRWEAANPPRPYTPGPRRGGYYGGRR